MRSAPSDDAFQLDRIVSDGTNLHQLGFDGLDVSHNTSMAHVTPPAIPSR
jgi:hypothetical protein